MNPSAAAVSIASGLRFHASPWTTGLSVALVCLVAAVSLAGWWRSGWKPGVGLVELVRLAVALLVALLLNQPEWVEEERPVDKPVIAVLVDDSPSMGTLDVRQDAGAVSRGESVVPLSDDRFWQSLADRYDVVVEPFSSLRPDSAASAPTGTNLFEPIASAARRHPRLRAMVVASDGDWNEGKPPVQATTALRLAGVPVLAVPTGSTIPLPDVEVESVECAVTGVVGKPFRVPFTIRSTLPREETVPVTIRTSDGQEFTRQVRLAPMAGTSDAILWTPSTVGDYTVAVRVPVQPGEVVPDNNAREAPVAIREEKLRVLLVESVPRWEYRYLRNALSRDPGVELSCLLFQTGLAQPGGGSRDAISRFPGSIEELAAYDVVFLGDVGIDDGQLTEDDCRLLRQLVEYQASGLVFMPGWLGNELSLERTALSELLPVVLDESRPEGTGTVTPGHFVLTDKGRSSLLTRLADAADENASVWEGLPGFQWYGPVARAKAGSEVLAVHDEATTESGRVPLLVTRSFGAGKVLFMATDGAWRWRKGVEDKYHYRFWGQVVRWMAYRRSMQKGERMRLLWTPEQPEAGQVVALDAGVGDSLGEPLSSGTVTVTARSPSGVTETVRLLAPGEQGAWGMFSGSWTPREPGSHEVTLACAETGDRLEAKIFVQGSAGETAGAAARPDVLEELARLTGGSVTSPGELPRLVEALGEMPDTPPEVRRTRLWAHPATLATLVCLLGAFWVGRKWQGLV